MKRLCYQLELGKELADVSTECCSRYRGESEEVRTNVAIYSHALLIVHVIRGQKLVRVTPPFPASSLQWPSNQGIPVLNLS